MIQHDAIQTVLSNLGCDLDASSAHGSLCGYLCCKVAGKAKTSWFKKLLKSTGLSPGTLAEHSHGLKLLDQLFESTLSELNSPDMEFAILLPDEEQGVDDRIVALGSWCRQFSKELGATSAEIVESIDSMPADSKELLADFLRIAEVSANQSESDENSLAELEEYVRMGTLLIVEELQPTSVASQQLH